MFKILKHMPSYLRSALLMALGMGFVSGFVGCSSQRLGSQEPYSPKEVRPIILVATSARRLHVVERTHQGSYQVHQDVADAVQLIRSLVASRSLALFLITLESEPESSDRYLSQLCQTLPIIEVSSLYASKQFTEGGPEGIIDRLRSGKIEVHHELLGPDPVSLDEVVNFVMAHVADLRMMGHSAIVAQHPETNSFMAAWMLSDAAPRVFEVQEFHDLSHEISQSQTHHVGFVIDHDEGLAQARKRIGLSLRKMGVLSAGIRSLVEVGRRDGEKVATFALPSGADLPSFLRYLPSDRLRRRIRELESQRSPGRVANRASAVAPEPPGETTRMRAQNIKAHPRL